MQVPSLQVLLRELSRDAVELLRALVGSTSFPTIPADKMAGIAGRNAHALGAARRALAQQQQRPDSANERTSATASPAKGGKDSLNSVNWTTTVAHALLPVRYHS
jgi:hypothetical protein